QREEKLKDLPVEVIEYKLNEEEQVCPCCNGRLHEMSTEVRQEIHVIPAQVKLVKHVRYVYACRSCEKEGIETPIITATMPKPILPGSLSSASMLAHIITQKYVNSIPLYRQEQEFERLGVDLSRQTMANWTLNAADPWLKILYDRMHDHLLKQDILHADETTLQVLQEEGRGAKTSSYMWLYRTGRECHPIVLYDTRRQEQASIQGVFFQVLKDISMLTATPATMSFLILSLLDAGLMQGANFPRLLLLFQIPGAMQR
ncbi:hypothetical protein Q428_15175, partial [Fervidicella metallireducens AeB]